MPPRITRNSDRPRASDRTMVDSQDQVRLPSFRTRLAWSPPEDETEGNGKPTRAKPLDRIGGHAYREWAGCRDQNLLGLRSRQNFFLDIPFYRTHFGTPVLLPKRLAGS